MSGSKGSAWGHTASDLLHLFYERCVVGIMELPSSQYNFLWVEGFPLFSPPENAAEDTASNRLAATHHPFTAPVAEDLPLLHRQPEKVRGQHYDLVLNGVEIGGGSIRIHSPKLQTFVFEEVLKVSRGGMHVKLTEERR